MSNIFALLIKIYKALYLFAYNVTGNYGYSLVLLSFFTFVVLYPYNKKAQQLQQKEHKIQKALSPQIDSIKKQYSGQEQYENLQWLYQRYGYHPLYAIRSAFGLVCQIPFLTAAYYMLSGLAEIQGVPWGIIPNLGAPDHLLVGINMLPFVMTLVTCVYAFVMPGISQKERLQTVAIGILFLMLLYSAPSALLIFWTCNLIWSLLDSVFSEKLGWISDFVVENELAFHIIFALALTMGLLVPVELYIKNASQLWFDLKDILKYFLGNSVKYFLFLLFIYYVCWRKKIRCACLSVLLGLLFGVFLQSYIVGLDYGLFDGHEIEWEKYTKAGIVNTFIWLACLIETFVVFKRLKFDPERIKKYVKPITFGIIAIQCAVLLITLKNSPIQKDILYEDGKAGILTTKNLFKVSAQNNIIVFLLDAFDAAVFEEIQQTNPEAISNFKDFTFYPDTTSSFGFTIYSLPEILTGRYFDPSKQKYPFFLNAAWNNNPYYEVLKDNNYIVSLYTLGDFLDKKAPVDNLITEKVAMNDSIANKFNMLVKFRLAPHYLKKLYYQYDSDIQSSMILNEGVKPYEIDDIKFYANLRKGIKIEEKDNCLQFYHLQGIHYPWNLDENLEPLKEGAKGSSRGAALGRLKIVNEYMEQLRSHRLYDNATIAILADHGYNHMLGRRPVFLVKQPHVNNEYLKTDNSSLTVAELMPLVCKRFNYLNTDNHLTRLASDVNRMFFYEEKDGGFSKYRIKNDARKETSWELVGKVEQYRGGNRKYHIGDVIDFSAFGDSDRYKGTGWSINPTIGFSDINQFEAEMTLEIEGDLHQDNYIFAMRAYPILSALNLPYKKLRLFVNHISVGEWKFEKDDFEKVTCKIPRTIINNRVLTLRFVVDVPENERDNERVKNNVKFIVDKMQIVEANE